MTHARALFSSFTARLFHRWLFETGRLGPEYDIFRCVVNIPEDVVKVGSEPNDDDHMTVLTSSTTVPTYGGTACTLVGNDERNGRVNPALEVNDDEIDLSEMKRRKARRMSNQQQQNRSNSTTTTTTVQGQTAL